MAQGGPGKTLLKQAEKIVFRRIWIRDMEGSKMCCLIEFGSVHNQLKRVGKPKRLA